MSDDKIVPFNSSIKLGEYSSEDSLPVPNQKIIKYIKELLVAAESGELVGIVAIEDYYKAPSKIEILGKFADPSLMYTSLGVANEYFLRGWVLPKYTSGFIDDGDEQ